MRPQQQNRRMRGRNNNNNNNRKGGPNPLTRSYESNGPDVKIRGNAQQIAEKYSTLARDAMSSGDRVMAENYLQHAEHYNRIIAAAQAQLPIQNFQQQRDDFDDEDGDEGDFDRAGGGFEGNAQPQPAAVGSGPQPVIDGVPAEVALNGEGNGNGNRDYNGREDRRDGFRNRDRRDRNRDFQNGHRNGDYPRRDQQTRPEQQAQDGEQSVEGDEVVADSLPDFLTGGAQPAEAAPKDDAPPRRGRRPRRGERAQSDSEGVPADGEQPVASEAQPAAEAFVGSDE